MRTIASNSSFRIALILALLHFNVSHLQASPQAFDHYTQQAREAHAEAATYMKDIWYTSPADYAVLQAIEALPVDVGGLHPTADQAKQWTDALGKFGKGADFMVSQNTFVVNFATELHDALNQTIRVAGVASLAVTGAQLLVEEGCTAFVAAAAKQMVNTAVGVAAGTLANSALALAQRYGLGIDPDLLRVGLDAIQVFSLVKAARAQRKAAGANCFAAGTLVTEGNGTKDQIQTLHIGERIATNVFYSGKGAPPPVIGDPNSTQVDPATWREVTLDMPDPKDPGNDYRMQLLEPLSWIAQNGAKPGSWVSLNLPELQINGNAHVDAIEACPTRRRKGATTLCLGPVKGHSPLMDDEPSRETG
jgi:hypothetical protein